MAILFSEFTRHYLIKNLTDKRGVAKHTKHIKKLFYKFASKLKVRYDFNMWCCAICNAVEHNGRPLVFELDHINGNTSDSRMSNLRMLCPNCHSQTDNYKGRTRKIEKVVRDLKLLCEGI